MRRRLLHIVVFAALALACSLAQPRRLDLDDCPPPLEKSAPLAPPFLLPESIAVENVYSSGQLNYTYGMAGKDDLGNIVDTEVPINLAARIVSISGGTFGCVRFPRDDEHKTERTYCIPLPLQVDPKNPGSLSQYLSNTDSFAAFDLGNSFWRTTTICRHENGCYEIGTDASPEVMSLKPEFKARRYSLKGYEYLGFSAKTSRQRIADQLGNYSDYVCITLVPNAEEIELPTSITGEVHACFRVRGPIHYRNP